LAPSPSFKEKAGMRFINKEGMTQLYNLEKYKFLRRKLRQDITVSEKIFWRRLRDRRFNYKFRRQYSVGKYIIDFYCPQLRLAIEIDGATHETKEQLENDRLKEEFLKSHNIILKRYLNVDLKENIGAVMDDLYNFIEKITSPHPSP
jgi:very-short-patch-repair endonuclease